MARPLISCIVPCFNGERFLAECLQSIVAQTYRPFEVIVVDDGSTDDSRGVVDRFGGAVRYHQQENGGPAAACNTGIALSSGEFVAFLEQDDLWMETKLEHQLAAMDEELDWSVTHIQNEWVPGLWHEARLYRDDPIMKAVPGYVVQTLLARRRAFDRVGRFDQTLRFASASDWFMRAEDAGSKGILISDVLTRRRLHENNFSRMNRRASHDQFLHLIKSMLDRRRAKNLGPAL